MEREIKIVVKVSDEDHAKKIQEDVLNATKLRTPIYFVSDPVEPSKFINTLHEERNRSR